MVLLDYNHLTTIATTDALAPLHFPSQQSHMLPAVENYTFYIVTPLTIWLTDFFFTLVGMVVQLMAWHLFAA